VSKLSCGGLRVVMTVGLGVLACSHAHGLAGRGGGGATKPPVDAGGAPGERDPGAAKTPDRGAVPDAETPAGPRIGPIRRAAPFVFVPHPGTATLARVTKTLRAATMGPSAELRVEIGCPEGARVVDRGKTLRLPLGKDEARSAVVDPGAQWIAVELARGRIEVFARAQLRRLGTWDGQQPIALASDLLVMRHDCRWVGVDPSKPDATPKVLADDVCGDVVHVDAAVRRISIAQPIPDGAGVRAIVHVGDGGDPVRVELPTDPPLGAAAVSADGKILCGIVSGPGKPTLQCRPLAGGPFERVAQGVVGPLRFATDMPRLAFAVALGTGNDAMDLHVADFDQRFVRKLGRVHQHRFAFLPGGDRLVAYEGGRGIVFQLDSGYLVPFGGREDDWAAVVPLPSTQDAFLATRLHNRCNDLVKITLPKD